MAERRHLPTGGEDQQFDRKSLRTVTGKTADFGELAKDCVCFANGAGGQIVVGIEDDATEPPPGQRVPTDLLDHVR
ncbi:MAG: putative DNA binding domain-containing protein, partial [Planctomycetales bacterium]|nr:putative DNA binding domain-containing protein [Planctomycetales bacterium]